MIRKTKGGKEIIDISYDEAAQIVITPTNSKVIQARAIGRISRASLEESTQRALATHQDAKIPDGLIVIDKDLLQEIRDLITLCTLIDKSGQCKAMSDKLDKIYPFLC